MLAAFTHKNKMVPGRNGDYSLTWKNYKSDFAAGFHSLYREETMVDVTLAVEGVTIQAHKIVLSVCSPYFYNLFKMNPCQHPIVFLKDVSQHVVNSILDFIYKGEVNVREDDLPVFLQLAESLQIKGLSGEYAKNKRGPSVKKARKRTASQSTDTDEEGGKKLQKYSRRSVKKKKKPKDKVEPTKIAPISNKTVSYNDATEISDSDNDPLVNLVTLDVDDDGNTQTDYDDGQNQGSDLFSMASEVTSRLPESGEQGGVNYQMIQTKRGRDMLLYDGYTFTQNRMCKDGMRWQCSVNKCKAFCRMSSAGWLTPYKTDHEHEKPAEAEIRRRILRMELKARAQSSGATPGEIIRNALPPDEYQTTDQRACFTRCIQRFRKSLLKNPNTWSTEANPLEDEVKEDCKETEDWLPADRSHNLSPKPIEKHPLVEGIWSVHPQPVELTDEEKRQLNEEKDITHTKLGAYDEL